LKKWNRHRKQEIVNLVPKPTEMSKSVTHQNGTSCGAFRRHGIAGVEKISDSYATE